MDNARLETLIISDGSSDVHASLPLPCQFQIGSGLANLYRTSDELDFGQGISGSGFSPRTFQLITPEAAPVPEPATLLLIGTGLAGLAASKRRRISH